VGSPSPSAVMRQMVTPVVSWLTAVTGVLGVVSAWRAGLSGGFVSWAVMWGGPRAIGPCSHLSKAL